MQETCPTQLQHHVRFRFKVNKVRESQRLCGQTAASTMEAFEHVLLGMNCPQAEAVTSADRTLHQLTVRVHPNRIFL